MEWVLVIGGSLVLQTAAGIILQPASFWRWVTGATLIGFAYQLPLWVLR